MNSESGGLSERFTEEQFKELEDLAALNYTIRQIAMYFDIKPMEMYQEFNLPDSKIKYHYDRGQLVAQAQIDLANLQAAKTGNITAIERYDKKAKSIKYQQAKERIFKGD